MKRALLLPVLALTALGCRDTAATATHLTIEVPARAVAGEAFQVRLTAQDAQGRLVRDFSGPVALHADSAADLPHNAGFDGASGGHLSLPVRLLGAGSRHLFATAGGLKVVSSPIEVAPGPAAALAVSGGDGQSGVVGTPLPQPVSVTVSDAFGNAVGAGTVVSFESGAGGAAQPSQAATDASGTASTRITLGPVAGPQPVIARIASGAQVTLTVNAAAGPAVGIRVVSGDGQVAPAGTALPLPLVALVVDAQGNPAAGATVLWTATGGAQPSPVQATSDAAGLVQTQVTLSPAPTNATISAVLGTSTALFHAAPTGLSYGDPPSGNGKLRLELVGPGPVPGSLTLRLVAGQPLTGYTVGFDLPLRGPQAVLVDFTPGSALPPGSAPAAAQATIPASGPLAGQLVTAQSQKRSGAGAVATDAHIDPGAVFYTLTLAPQPGSGPGVIFDGNASNLGLQAGLLSFAGTEVVGAAGFALGRLEQH